MRVWRDYYFAGSTRVAMRVQTNATNELDYLLTDYDLAAQDSGSTTVRLHTNGLETLTQSHKPWGEMKQYHPVLVIQLYQAEHAQS